MGISRGGQNGKGQADKVIEVFRRLMGFEAIRKNMINNLPRCCFADRAGYCDDFEISLFAIPGGEVAEGFYRISDFENYFAWKLVG